MATGLCLSKTFSAIPEELGGVPLVLDEWMPLDRQELTSVNLTLIGGDPRETVRAILDEAGDAILDEAGNAVLEE